MNNVYDDDDKYKTKFYKSSHKNLDMSFDLMNDSVGYWSYLQNSTEIDIPDCHSGKIATNTLE